MSSHAEIVFILEHYFESKSYAAPFETRDSGYIDKGILTTSTGN
jgi:hypothetical protein